MPDAFSRMEILLGDTGAEKLSRAKIAVFGLGGTGSYVAEALARCGVASLTLVDNERIAVSDINRQLYALRSTVGKSNVEIAKSRIKDIDEGILVHTYETFYNEETAGMFELNNYDYIVDAMNTAEAKLLLIEKAKKCGVPVISCMEMDFPHICRKCWIFFRRERRYSFMQIQTRSVLPVPIMKKDAVLPFRL